jgi:hypothetical protein
LERLDTTPVRSAKPGSLLGDGIEVDLPCARTFAGDAIHKWGKVQWRNLSRR